MEVNIHRESEIARLTAVLNSTEEKIAICGVTLFTNANAKLLMTENRKNGEATRTAITNDCPSTTGFSMPSASHSARKSSAHCDSRSVGGRSEVSAPREGARRLQILTGEEGPVVRSWTSGPW